MKRVEIPEGFSKGEHFKKENYDTNPGVCNIQKDCRAEDVYWENTVEEAG